MKFNSLEYRQVIDDGQYYTESDMISVNEARVKPASSSSDVAIDLKVNGNDNDVADNDNHVIITVNAQQPSKK